jgi:glutamyl-tRNA synthetase
VSARVTRLAPSPTGALHLGNARTFLINWAIARQSGWRIILRIEDLDGPRVKGGADVQAIEDLRWLGIDWDEGPVYQSHRTDRYREAIARLIKSGDAYPCVCTRREVETAASAPHAEDGAAIYPGTCHGRFASVDAARAASGREPAIRFRVPDERVEFVDQFRGLVSFDVARELGDFVIAKADNTAAYQLAVVVDDLEMGITDVIRGDDLVDSTPRQMLLYRAMGAGGSVPRYTHLPLIVGPDGRRLAKRHGDTRVRFYRERGVLADRVLQLMARWSGIASGRDVCSAREFAEMFKIESMPRTAITFGDDDHAQLTGEPKRAE